MLTTLLIFHATTAGQLSICMSPIVCESATAISIPTSDIDSEKEPVVLEVGDIVAAGSLVAVKQGASVTFNHADWEKPRTYACATDAESPLYMSFAENVVVIALEGEVGVLPDR